MDFLIKHWATFPRRFPSGLPVASTATIPAKRQWIRRAFHSCNFSLILRGEGEFTRQGRTWPIAAPCVLTQWPGEHLEYGPHETWFECYVIYAAELRSRLAAVGFIDPSRPVWPIANPELVQIHLDELQRLTAAPAPESVADRVDRVWERVLLETLLVAAPESEAHRLIHRVVADLQRNLSAPVDFHGIAARCGVSLPTLRRKWMHVVNVPPGRYLQQLRMREACRLLVETTLPIREIATTVGYPDEFHFSRRFRANRKLPPREYRRRFQLVLPQ